MPDEPVESLQPFGEGADKFCASCGRLYPNTKDECEKGHGGLADLRRNVDTHDTPAPQHRVDHTF